MPQTTGIEWVVSPRGLRGFTSNPIKGKCEQGCDYCYAERLRQKFGWPEKMSWYAEELFAIEKRKKPATYFMGSMYDIFGSWVPRAWIGWIVDTAKNCPQHRFLFLSKNPERYGEFDFPSNCWLGTTITKNEDIWRAAYFVRKVNQKYRTFVSLEPLLGPVDPKILPTFDWIILGALTKDNRTVPESEGGTKLEWALEVASHARSMGIPLFIKDNLAKTSRLVREVRDIPYLHREIAFVAEEARRFVEHSEGKSFNRAGYDALD